MPMDRSSLQSYLPHFGERVSFGGKYIAYYMFPSVRQRHSTAIICRR